MFEYAQGVLNFKVSCFPVFTYCLWNPKKTSVSPCLCPLLLPVSVTTHQNVVNLYYFDHESQYLKGGWELEGFCLLDKSTLWVWWCNLWLLSVFSLLFLFLLTSLEDRPILKLEYHYSPILGVVLQLDNWLQELEMRTTFQPLLSESLIWQNTVCCLVSLVFCWVSKLNLTLIEFSRAGKGGGAGPYGQEQGNRR